MFFALVTSVSAYGQRIEMSGAIEKTAVGYAWGVRAGLSGRYVLQPGVFFQSASNQTLEPVRTNVTSVGAYVYVSLITTEKIQFGALWLVGLTDQKFIYTTPAVETRIFVRNHLMLTFGAGYRYGYPSVSAGAGVRFFNK
jgi:hypothetical protein